ncbi:hypothetical protein I4641_23105 [Waterburya agarophytonicola K14]|uniref:Uncharacterized protein n=1 Tax=Waterburya agarophytonicola KI4 TaxID=2874699 RepID=A0A964FIF6_9CYAN|nr:hypothetical protein [Waterburya agarophytonicola KI4]
MPTNLTDRDFKILIEALENCPSIQDPQSRNEIIDLLGDLARPVKKINALRGSILSILKVLSGFPNQFDLLLEAINFYEENSDYYQNLLKVVKQIAINQQKQENNKSLSGEFESELEINKNFIEPSVENIWKALCLILNEVKWQDIWDACKNIKELTKDDKKYLKSLCFTKNYDFLKQKIVTLYNPSQIILEFGQLLKPYSNKIDFWLKQASQELAIGENNQSQNKSQHENSNPILFIIVDRCGNGKNQDKWEVKAQLKCQNEEIIDIQLSSETIGIYCDEFQDIPQVIRQYIDKLEQDSEFRNKGIGNLRVEVFLPIISLNTSLEEWLMESKNQAFTKNLITKYCIFLRSRERYKQNSRIDLLENGWKKLSDFIANDNHKKVTKTIIKEIIDQTQKPNILEISEKDCIDNWIELQITLQECSFIWGVNWKSSLPSEIDKRIELFEFIYNSGIPIVFWYWYCVPEKVNIESKFEECLSKNNLNNRCQKLLEKTWNMRRIPWGTSDKKKRKTYPGYYFGMLLEDPELIPDDVCY